MMTIREIAREGIPTEHALRRMLKAGRLPAIYIGCKALVNYDQLVEQLSNLKGSIDDE
jgi:predicted transcriptional regulator